MPVKLNSTGGGSVTLTTPATASDFTATFPANTGNVVTDSATQTLTNKTLSSPLVMSVSVITSGTEQASTSGTSIDFTGIPSWVKRVTVLLRGVSTNGTSNPLIQLGAGSVTSSGYVSTSGSSDTFTVSTSTSGFVLRSALATNVLTGAITISSAGDNIWLVAGLVNNSAVGGVVVYTTGGVTLSGTLDRVRITTVGGTNTFDAGSINILYE